MPRKRRGSEVKARISDDLKLKVRALAAMIADEENESLVIREALVEHFKRPEIRSKIEEGMQKLLARGEIGEIPNLDD